MPTLSRYTNETLPEAYAHQIRDFIRIYWFDMYFHIGIDAPVMRPEWKAQLFVIGEGQALFSHASAVSRPVTCAGETYSCGGLSGVLTYPAYQKLGYGHQVVQAATDSMTAPEFDLAILWTGDDLISFYGKFGWEYDPNFKTFKGDAEKNERHDPPTLIRFLSDRAKANKQDFLTHPIYLGDGAW